MWMDCIRPSIISRNIFKQDFSVRRLDWALNAITKLMDSDVYAYLNRPFELNIDATLAILASRLTDGSDSSAFGIPRPLYSVRFYETLSSAVGSRLSEHLKVLIYLSSFRFTSGPAVKYRVYSADEIRFMRNYAGTQVLIALDSLLKPLRLETLTKKPEKLKAIFLILVGTIAATNYTSIEENETIENRMVETQKDTLIRLLSHYLVYLGKSISLLDSSCNESVLISTVKRQFKPTGSVVVRVSFRPAHGSYSANINVYIPEQHNSSVIPGAGSAKERCVVAESLDVGDTDFVDLIEDLDMLKCIPCGKFWPNLDINSICDDCRRL
ncbi:hypothetical protein AOQ84DRAFT_74097 [Glonium stellatum]|uniref:Uncharacterized protein n=1 Tax=Glonium stellatum TaxID=574774 RepID=A0A8E2EXA0_9PEZI|nr:hypothetical protein AOQ84DRAFT_74097 [Glonium stellatum]